MKKLFVPYNITLLAKEKGFNQDCLGYYGNEERLFITAGAILKYRPLTKAPLYIQLIDWFREKDIHVIIRPGFGYPTWYSWMIVSRGKEDIYSGENESYENINDCYNASILEAFKLI